ncbi:MAG TPA: LD-carboxypeptidase, partial [Sphingobacterium sp.]|nr:LD-carboxypeptidase [Sphingobacterium sp.]
SLETLRDALFGKMKGLQYSYSDFPHHQGQAEGVLTGGNLALLQSIIGSRSDVNYDDKILFIEDVSEAHYNIDRMLWTLKRANKLRKLRGLIVGGFTDLREESTAFGQSVEEIIMDKVGEYGYPVAFGCPAGHIADNRALIFGKQVELSVKDDKVSIVYKD